MKKVFLFLIAIVCLLSCKSIQEEVPVSSISISPLSAQLTEGETVQLKATVFPSNATEQTVRWASSNESVVTVAADGWVTAVAEGAASVSASAGGITVSCKIAVNKPVVAVTALSLDKSALTLAEGEDYTLEVSIQPQNATDKTVVWTTSAPDIVWVDAGTVSALKEGEAVVTARAGEITASCTVTVTRKTVAVESVKLSRIALQLTVGDMETLEAKVYPENATDKSVIWSSSAPDVAKVEGGKVTALKEGEAVITAKAGGKSAECSVVVSKEVIAVESVTLDKTTLELVEGASYTLVASVSPENATDKTVAWSSSAPDIATVEGGTVTALKEGRSVITAKAGGQSATCLVTVSKKVVAVESIELDKAALELMEGETAELVATVKPDDATDKRVTWSSTDTSVVTVKEGKITAVKEGKASIVAKAGGLEARCEVTVSKLVIAVSSITINKTELAMKKGDQAVLTATVKPDNATDKTVSWQSSSPEVASVDQTGKVSALKSGTATITATAGELTATCEVTVSNPVVSIVLDKQSLTLEEGQETVLTATIDPADADEQTISWSSSDEAVVTVDQAGKVKAVKEGTATITASVGNLSAVCKVSVYQKVIQATSVTLSKTSLSLEKGKSEQLTATVKPDDTTDKTVSWTSSDKNVATVDQDGNVLAVGSGAATITAACGDVSATCAVTVTVPVASVSLDVTSVILKQYETVQLHATVSPSDATDQALTWSSGNPEVASVAEGFVKALKEGSATITVTAGGKSATCIVTVSNATAGGNEGTGDENWDNN